MVVGITSLVMLLLSVQDACTSCGGDGLIACRTHGEEAEAVEKAVLFCSVVASCGACGGTLLAPCPRCQTAPPAEWGQRKEQVAAWLKTMRRTDTFLECALLHMETQHFILTYGVKRLPYGQRGLGAHEGAHLYAVRLEEFFQRFCTDFSVTEADFLAKTQVMIFDSGEVHAKASLEYTLQSSDTASKLMGKTPVFTIFYDRSHLHEEFELHQAVVHHVTHCLLSNVWDGIWPGKELGGWLDAGAAHHYEIEMFGGVRHYCWREADTMRLFKFGKWESLVKELVTKGRKEPMLQLLVKATDQLTPEEHALSWSVVDFIRAEHAGRLGAVAKAVKEKQPLGVVFHTALGMGASDVEEGWKKYVLKNYGKRKR
ncbi:MAG: hypothetical protein AB1486_22550 [Planctomycetota bacterium]